MSEGVGKTAIATEYTIHSRIVHPPLPTNISLPPTPYHEHYPVIMTIIGNAVPQLVCKLCGCGFDTPPGIENIGFATMSSTDLFASVNEFWKNFSKLGRNEKCPCGSGKKYKRCHLLLNLPK